MANYLNCAETAKILRKALKEAFPDVKFSVKSSTYSMGASINVRWVDGPCAGLVDGVAEVFSGSYFDGMTDYKGSKTHLYQGQETRLGADFVITTRSNSDAAIEKAIARVVRTYAEEFAATGDVAPTVQAFRRGELTSMRLPSMPDDMQTCVRTVLYKSSDRMAAKKSKTAANMLHIASDGRAETSLLEAV